MAHMGGDGEHSDDDDEVGGRRGETARDTIEDGEGDEDGEESEIDEDSEQRLNAQYRLLFHGLRLFIVQFLLQDKDPDNAQHSQSAHSVDGVRADEFSTEKMRAVREKAAQLNRALLSSSI